ncbi:MULTISPECIES: hypothetical protein [unclassified Nostoc]|uniref:hypothetical protein n=1 Tax=unclassified Nostoc TaxID=2593658 RepID=UPI0025F5BDB2|nr:hypothetical protein [Nostoc sp. JL33]MBN3871834.1 hypothetical protein [Nostoc sp. JL33]
MLIELWKCDRYRFWFKFTIKRHRQCLPLLEIFLAWHIRASPISELNVIAA